MNSEEKKMDKRKLGKLITQLVDYKQAKDDAFYTDISNKESATNEYWYYTGKYYQTIVDLVHDYGIPHPVYEHAFNMLSSPAITDAVSPDKYEEVTQ